MTRCSRCGKVGVRARGGRRGGNGGDRDSDRVRLAAGGKWQDG